MTAPTPKGGAGRVTECDACNGLGAYFLYPRGVITLFLTNGMTGNPVCFEMCSCAVCGGKGRKP